jgi:hypothetical protein
VTKREQVRASARGGRGREKTGEKTGEIESTREREGETEKDS